MFDFHHVDVLKTIVVAEDVFCIGALTDVEHTHVLAIDVEHGRATSLPVEVDVLAHGALNDGIAEVEVAKVVTTVAQRERLELRDARLLVGEELILELLMVRVETLVGIEHHRLQRIAARLSTLDARLAELVEGTLLTLSGEELDVDRTTPVVVLLVCLAVVIGEEADGSVVQVFVVGLNREDGRRHLSGMEDI